MMEINITSIFRSLMSFGWMKLPSIFIVTFFIAQSSVFVDSLQMSFSNFKTFTKLLFKQDCSAVSTWQYVTDLKSTLDSSFSQSENCEHLHAELMNTSFIRQSVKFKLPLFAMDMKLLLNRHCTGLSLRSRSTVIRLKSPNLLLVIVMLIPLTLNQFKFKRWMVLFVITAVAVITSMAFSLIHLILKLKKWLELMYIVDNVTLKRKDF